MTLEQLLAAIAKHTGPTPKTPVPGQARRIEDGSIKR